MKSRFHLRLFLAAAGVIGCGSSQPTITDPRQLKPESEEEVQVSKDLDRKINEEEGGSFGGKPPKAGAARR